MARITTGVRARGRIAMLDGGLELMRLEGLGGLTLQGLADHIGRTRSAVFHHFANAGELRAAVIERAIERRHVGALAVLIIADHRSVRDWPVAQRRGYLRAAAR